MLMDERGSILVGPDYTSKIGGFFSVYVEESRYSVTIHFGKFFKSYLIRCGSGLLYYFIRFLIFFRGGFYS